MVRTQSPVWLRIAVALCLAVLGLSVGAAADTPRKAPKCDGHKATIVGTGKADKIKGTRKADVIVAKGGNDVVIGKGGADIICAGPGNDVVKGGGKADRLLGEAGKDHLTGGPAADSLDGGRDDDLVDGQTDADRVLGGTGKDTVLGGTGNDTLDGGADPDSVAGGEGDDQETGGSGTDNLTGGPGADRLDGGDGDDTIAGDDGVDQLLGSAGHDNLTDTSAGADSLDGGADIDLCTHTAGDTVAVGCDFDFTDPVVFAPFGGAPSRTSVGIQAVSEIAALDLYVLLDRSGSMATEITAIKNNLSTVVHQLTCAPLGSGVPPDCLDNLWAGAGTIGYTGSGAAAYVNYVDVAPNPSFASLPTTEPTGCCAEVSTFATWATITGNGGAAYSLGSVPARSTCVGSPAAENGSQTFGYPCFRQAALPLVVMATDEGPLTGSDTSHVPDWSTVVLPAMAARGARLLGVYGSGAPAEVHTDLQTMATNTGAVDLNNASAPLVIDGGGANAATGIKNGVLAFLHGAPLDVTPVAADDPADAIQAVDAFVSRIETSPAGTAACANVPDVDTNADTVADSYWDTVPGTPLCWNLVVKPNTTVAATSTDQVYRAYVDVTLKDVGQIVRRPVYFVVPHP